jgi:phosphate transport system ATP-binding protein
MVLMSALSAPSAEPVKASPGATQHLGALARSVARTFAEPAQPAMEAVDLSVSFDGVTVIEGINHAFISNRVTSVIGPSGCGKTTLLRALNRMHSFTPGARVLGSVLLDGVDIYGPTVDPIAVRQRVGMVFQRPNPFPTMSIAANVDAGLRLSGVNGHRPRRRQVIEDCLRRAALWNEVQDRLNRPAVSLSGGQQQRLCIARALAMEPQVLLMDEPCAALDPIATLRIEELILKLRQEVTIIVVTHNLQQAARISDALMFMLADERRVGTVIEAGTAVDVFANPADPRTEAYLTGRMG